MTVIFYVAEIGGYPPNYKYFSSLAHLDTYMRDRGWTKVSDPDPKNNSKGQWERMEAADFLLGLQGSRATVYVSFAAFEDQTLRHGDTMTLKAPQHGSVK